MELRRVVGGVAAVALVAAASAANAAPVYTVGNVVSWNVGSGQSNGQFQVASDSSFGRGIEIGLRAQQRRVGPIAPVGDVYTVNLGYDDQLPVATNRAWWNFDFSVFYGTGVNGGVNILNNLDSVTLSIESFNTANTPRLASFDLLALFPPAGSLLQDSQNPVFFPWFNPAFDMNDDGAYRFTLTATQGNESISTTMCVANPGNSCPPANVPEPMSLSLLGAGLAAALVRRAARS